MFLTPLSAEEEEETFVLRDADTGRTVETFDSYEQARQSFETMKEEYGNLTIVRDGKVLNAEYGAVLFDHTGCQVLNFINAVDRTENSLNGCDGADGLYLSTDETGENVLFMISGVRGWMSTESVTIVPDHDIERTLSAYRVVDGNLYHEIKTQMEDDLYDRIIYHGKAPSFLKEGQTYLSYDGHYFYPYERLRVLSDDMREAAYSHSLNPHSPYYDYYQFVSHRSLTHVSLEQAEQWLKDSGIMGAMSGYQSDEANGIDDTLNRSQLYGMMPYFWQYQYQYGANALMMLSESITESGFGRSLTSYTRNNLFSHAAYDTQREADASRFDSVERSVYSHAKYYLSGSYFSPLKTQYHGAFFGNKSAGMNVDYSADPYWGETAAAQYRQMDERFGSPDGDTVTIAVKSSDVSVPVYSEASSLSPVLYRTKQNPDFAAAVIETIENDEGTWYRILSDATLDDEGRTALEYSYDYLFDFGCVRSEDFELLFDGSDREQNFRTLAFEGVGGKFADGESTLAYAVPEGTAVFPAGCEKDGSVFMRWEETDEDRWHAVYKDIASLSIEGKPQNEYEMNDRLDLSGIHLKVSYTDRSSEMIEITSSMVSGFDLSQEGDQTVTVTYGGKTASWPIHVSEQKDQLRAEIYTEIVRMNRAYPNLDTLSEKQQAKVLELKQKIEENILPHLTQTELRSFDGVLRKVIGDRIRYIIDENAYDLSVSGLSLAMPLGNSLTKQEYFEDTYRVRAYDVPDENLHQTFDACASALNETLREGFRYRILKNYRGIETDYPLLMTIRKPDGSDDTDVFTVVYADHDTGDVKLCYTRQSDHCITFMTKGSGSYAVLSRRTGNVYSAEDPQETLRADNSSYDAEYIRANITAACGVFIAVMIAYLIWSKRSRSRKLVIQQAEREERLANEPPSPSDTTQAMHLFETEVLNLTELMEEEEENDQ